MRHVVVLTAVLGVGGCGGGGTEGDADRDYVHDAVEVADEVGPGCGNGTVESGEECDDGNSVAGDGCSPTCVFEHVCGDGFVDHDEECDDGNTVVGDGCSTACLSECGNGVVDGGEGCDLLDLDGETCATLGHESGGILRCGEDCQFDESDCRTCGDGTCDLGETSAACPADCPPACGDGSCSEDEDQFGCGADCGAVAVSAGDIHTCAVLADGTARCWGANWTGQLGAETGGGFSTVPVSVVGLTGVAAISAGGAGAKFESDCSHSCAVLVDGSVECWGCGYGGVLPVPVSGLRTAVGVSAATYYTCATLADRTADCWRQRGDACPTAVLGDLTGVVAVSAGRGLAYFDFERPPFFINLSHACALLGDGTLKCWGVCEAPLAVVGLTDAVSVSAGESFACAVLADGTARCWGENSFGQLGDGGTSTYVDVPVEVVGLTSVRSISAGWWHACAVSSDGAVWCWGGVPREGWHFADGMPESAVPLPVPGLLHAVSVSVGETHLCALLSDGTVECWGAGPLGDGTTDSSNVPVQVAAW